MGYDDDGKNCRHFHHHQRRCTLAIWHPERNKAIKEYKYIKDNYSWNDESEGELVYSEPATYKPPPKIYDLRTALNKSNKNDMVSDIDNAKIGAHKLEKKLLLCQNLLLKMLQSILSWI